MRHYSLLFLLILLGSKGHAQLLQAPLKDTMRFSKRVLVLPENYYAQHTGFFCKKELQLQKRTNVNVFFRLGSKEYVDYLEQKPNTRRF